MGDLVRSFPDAIIHGHPAKLRRVGRDIRDCSLHCDSGNLGVARIRRVAVIFGTDDVCMSPESVLGTDGGSGLPHETVLRFWEKYYPDALSGGALLSLEVLPGGHLAPVTHSSLYADVLLKNLGEKAEAGKDDGAKQS